MDLSKPKKDIDPDCLVVESPSEVAIQTQEKLDKMEDGTNQENPCATFTQV